MDFNLKGIYCCYVRKRRQRMCVTKNIDKMFLDRLAVCTFNTTASEM